MIFFVCFLLPTLLHKCIAFLLYEYILDSIIMWQIYIYIFLLHMPSFVDNEIGDAGMRSFLEALQAQDKHKDLGPGLHRLTLHHNVPSMCVCSRSI